VGVSPCQLPLSTGEGRVELQRFYYDASTRACRPFIYRGLRGNPNNFLTMAR
jgi:hypothetical protein